LPELASLAAREASAVPEVHHLGREALQGIREDYLRREALQGIREAHQGMREVLASEALRRRGQRVVCLFRLRDAVKRPGAE
jgi:hypothetical protein